MIEVVWGMGRMGYRIKAAAHPPAGSLRRRTETKVELCVDVPWLNAHTMQPAATSFHHPNG